MDGFVVPAGESWKIDGIVESTGSVVVRGTLVMRPGDTLRFTGIDEGAFVGGGMEPLPDTDVGLWIDGDGLLDAMGTPVAGWNRTGSDPTWKPDHEILVAPYRSGDDGSGGIEAYTLGAPVPEIVPGVPTEIFNLTRDCRIEGTPEGHAHVWLHSTKPQTIKHVAFRYVGPKDVEGRYGLHFHHVGDASRGSLVEGCVVRDGGHHAFVVHASHGVTLRDCIAYNTHREQYWWDKKDPGGSNKTPFTRTDDVFYDRCLGVLMTKRKFHKANFFLGRTEGGKIHGCAAVACLSQGEGSGYHWPSHANPPPNVWDWKDNVSHNHLTGSAGGARVWQNENTIHDVPGLDIYHCHFGIAAGAYKTPGYHWSEFHIEDVVVGLIIHAQATQHDFGEPGADYPDRPDGYAFSFENGVIRDAKVGVHTPRHVADAKVPTLLKDISFERISDVLLEVDEDRKGKGDAPGRLDFVDCTIDGRAPKGSDVRLVSVVSGFRARFQNGDEAWEIDDSGTVTRISPFYPLA